MVCGVLPKRLIGRRLRSPARNNDTYPTVLQPYRPWPARIYGLKSAFPHHQSPLQTIYQPLNRCQLGHQRKMNGNSGHHVPHAGHLLPDFTAEDIETFLGGVLSQPHSHAHTHAHTKHPHNPHNPHNPHPHVHQPHPHPHLPHHQQYLHILHGGGGGGGGGMGGDESADGTGSEMPGGGAPDLDSTGGGDHNDHDPHGDHNDHDPHGDHNDHEPFNVSMMAGAPEDQKAAVRTERKRCREKQRRSDVNRQFTELTAALRKVETESTDWARHTYTSTTNRADLIARSIYILNAVHEANESRKRRVVELERDLEQAKKAGEETAAKLKDQIMSPQQMGGGKMVMMVPMMIGGDSAPTPAMTMPAYGQMPFFIPQPPAVAASAGGDGPNTSINSNSNNSMAAMAMPPYMMQHMMMAAAAAQQQQHLQQQQQQQQQHHQSVMQANPLCVMGTTGTGAATSTTTAAATASTGVGTANGGSDGGGADLLASAMTDHGKKKAASSNPGCTNNVAHLA